MNGIGSAKVRLIACLAVIGLVLTACGSGSSKSSGVPGPITFLNVTDYSGPGNFAGKVLGGMTKIGCDQINKGGGILGHMCKVVAVDDKSDPADGASNLRLALTSNKNIVAVTGLSTATAAAEAPLAVGSKVVAFISAGSSAFLHLGQLYGANDKFSYTVLPADEMTGYAMAFGASRLGMTHPAVISTNTPETASILAGVKAGDAALGVTPAIELALAPTQPSYGTEVQRLVSAHPNGIIFELDAPTSGTFFTNMATAMGTINLPMISDTTSLTSDWVKAVQSALSAPTLQANLHIVDSPPSTTLPGLQPVSSVWDSLKTGVPFDCCLPFYDTVVMAGLAMLEAKSIDPKVYAPFITQVAATTANDGRVRVDTFAQGQQAIAAGHKIAYWGASGPLNWTADHVRVPDLEVFRWTPAASGGGGGETPEGLIISGKEIASKLHL